MSFICFALHPWSNLFVLWLIEYLLLILTIISSKLVSFPCHISFFSQVFFWGADASFFVMAASRTWFKYSLFFVFHSFHSKLFIWPLNSLPFVSFKSLFFTGDSFRFPIDVCLCRRHCWFKYYSLIFFHFSFYIFIHVLSLFSAAFKIFVAFYYIGDSWLPIARCRLASVRLIVMCWVFLFTQTLFS